MIICPNPNCGYRGEGKKVGGNNGCLILILLCFGILPGILYLLFCPRKGVVCPKCGVRIYWSVSWIFLQCGLDLTELIQNVFFVYGKCAGEFGTETSWRSFSLKFRQEVFLSGNIWKNIRSVFPRMMIWKNFWKEPNLFYSGVLFYAFLWNWRLIQNNSGV